MKKDLILQKEDLVFTDNNGQDVDYTSYYVVVSLGAVDIKLSLKPANATAKELLKQVL